MPEGDTIYRAAQTLHRALGGRVVVRFESVFPALMKVQYDAPLTGRTIEQVTSAGKHLLMRFSGGHTLRTHMRMNGSWHIYRPGERWKRPHHDMRIIVATSEFEAVGFNIPVAEFVEGDALRRHRELSRLVAALKARPLKSSLGLEALLDTIERDIPSESGMAALFARIGQQLSPRAKRRLLRNLIHNWAVLGSRIRNRLAEAGQWVPSFVVMSPTMRCNLKCTGCYSGLYSKRGELSEAEIRRILDECRSIGAYFVVVSGGEPFLLVEEAD